jgi:pilus assembly protein Flp/PilA
MKSLMKDFLKDESGATAIEYALIAVLLAVGIIGGARSLGTALNTRFTGFATTVGNP